MDKSIGNPDLLQSELAEEQKRKDELIKRIDRNINPGHESETDKCFALNKGNNYYESVSELFESIKDDHVKLGKYAFTTEYKSAIATSTAHLVGDKDAKLHALRLLSEKYCAAYMSAFDAATPPEVINHMNIFEFKITELSAKAKVIKY